MSILDCATSGFTKRLPIPFFRSLELGERCLLYIIDGPRRTIPRVLLTQKTFPIGLRDLTPVIATARHGSQRATYKKSLDDSFHIFLT